MSVKVTRVVGDNHVAICRKKQKFIILDDPEYDPDSPEYEALLSGIKNIGPAMKKLRGKHG